MEPPVTVTAIHIKERKASTEAFNVGYSDGLVQCFRTYGCGMIERILAKFPHCTVTHESPQSGVAA